MAQQLGGAPQAYPPMEQQPYMAGRTTQPSNYLDQFQQMGRGPVTPPTLLELLSGVDQKRFGMIPADRQLALAQQLYGMSQADAQSARVQQYLNNIGGGLNPNDQNFLSQMLLGNAHGAFSDAALGHGLSYGGKRYEHDNPHQTFQTADFGDTKSGYSFNPANGSLLELFNRQIGMTPYQSAILDLRHQNRAHQARAGIDVLSKIKPKDQNEIPTGSVQLTEDEKKQMRNANGQEILKYAQQQGISPAVAMERLGLLGNLDSEKLLSSPYLQKQTSEMFGLSGVDFSTIPQIASFDITPEPIGVPSEIPTPTDSPTLSVESEDQPFENFSQHDADTMVEIVEDGKVKKIPLIEWESIIKAAQNSPPLEINYARLGKKVKDSKTYPDSKTALLDWARDYFELFTPSGDISRLWRITNKNPEYAGFWETFFSTLRNLKERMEAAKDNILSKEMLKKMR